MKWLILTGDAIFLHDSCLLEQQEDDILYRAVEVEVKGHDIAVLKSYERFVSMAAKELDVTVSDM